MTTLTSCSADCVVWVNASNGELPSQAWVAWPPTDSYPTPTYVGRAAHNGGLFPATLLPHKGVAHVPWGGQNYEKDNYQVKDNYISWGKLFPFIFLCHLAFNGIQDFFSKPFKRVQISKCPIWKSDIFSIRSDLFLFIFFDKKTCFRKHFFDKKYL